MIANIIGITKWDYHTVMITPLAPMLAIFECMSEESDDSFSQSNHQEIPIEQSMDNVLAMGHPDSWDQQQ